MAAIRDLLNPTVEEPQRTRSPASSSSEFHPSPSIMKCTIPRAEKKPKNVKDAAVFRRNMPTGQIRFPPCEVRDEELTTMHKKFKIFPMGNIADFPRQIPYQSEKKDFQEKTGRDSFHVYQYTFQIPGGDGRVWTIMWDYNIGLVRTTHLFKCMDYAKTAPSKVMSYNHGLREICHSITGGALAAQGYWMPFEAAKHVAANFCWKIRYALTPIFGTDFPQICQRSEERARHISIPQSVIRYETERAGRFRDLETGHISKSETPTSPGSPAPSSTTTTTPAPRSSSDSTYSQSGGNYEPPSKYSRRTYADSIASARGSPPSVFHSEPPVSPAPSTFTPVNPPRSHGHWLLEAAQRPRSPRSLALWVTSRRPFRRAALERRAPEENPPRLMDYRKRKAPHCESYFDVAMSTSRRFSPPRGDDATRTRGLWDSEVEHSAGDTDEDQGQNHSPKRCANAVGAAHALVHMLHVNDSVETRHSRGPLPRVDTTPAWTRSPNISREDLSRRRKSL